MKSLRRLLFNSPIILTILLVLPAFTDIIRKLLPDQPNYITPSINTIYVIFIFFTGIGVIRKKPIKYVRYPLTILALFMSVYWLLTILYSLKVGFIVLLLRFTPLLIPALVYQRLKNMEKFEGVFLWLSLLVLFLFPISLYVIIKGNTFLPSLLKPIDQLIEAGKHKRGGFDICSAVFSNGVVKPRFVNCLLCFKHAQRKKQTLLDIIN